MPPVVARVCAGTEAVEFHDDVREVVAEGPEDDCEGSLLALQSQHRRKERRQDMRQPIREQIPQLILVPLHALLPFALLAAGLLLTDVQLVSYLLL